MRRKTRRRHWLVTQQNAGIQCCTSCTWSLICAAADTIMDAPYNYQEGGKKFWEGEKLDHMARPYMGGHLSGYRPVKMRWRTKHAGRDRLLAGLPRSCPMPINADQNSGIDPNVDQFRSMPINSDQFLSMPINGDQCQIKQNWSALRGIDQNWSALRGNDRHWEAFRINAMILMGIDGHWSALGIDRGSPDYNNCTVWP